jgi:hypothetical protein
MPEILSDFKRPSNPDEIRAYLTDNVYPILDSSIEALLRHVFSKSKAAASGATQPDEDDVPFSPLLWLSDHLRQYSR